MDRVKNGGNSMDTTGSQQSSSLVSLWNAILPKISFARRIVLSAVGDLLQKQNDEVLERKERNRETLHWTSTNKSVWTLSTMRIRQSRQSSIYINPSLLKEILLIDKELSSVLKDLNLSREEKGRVFLQQLVSKSNRNVALINSKCREHPWPQLSDGKTNNIPTESSNEDKSASTISFYSHDSMDCETTEKSYASNETKKKNLVIRCNYIPSSEPSSMNSRNSYCKTSPSICVAPTWCRSSRRPCSCPENNSKASANITHKKENNKKDGFCNICKKKSKPTHAPIPSAESVKLCKYRSQSKSRSEGSVGIKENKAPTDKNKNRCQLLGPTSSLTKLLKEMEEETLKTACTKSEYCAAVCKSTQVDASKTINSGTNPQLPHQTASKTVAKHGEFPENLWPSKNASETSRLVKSSPKLGLSREKSNMSIIPEEKLKKKSSLLNPHKMNTKSSTHSKKHSKQISTSKKPLEKLQTSKHLNLVQKPTAADRSAPHDPGQKCTSQNISVPCLCKESSELKLPAASNGCSLKTTELQTYSHPLNTSTSALLSEDSVSPRPPASAPSCYKSVCTTDTCTSMPKNMELESPKSVDSGVNVRKWRCCSPRRGRCCKKKPLKPFPVLEPPKTESECTEKCTECYESSKENKSSCQLKYYDQCWHLPHQPELNFAPNDCEILCPQCRSCRRGRSLRSGRRIQLPNPVAPRVPYPQNYLETRCYPSHPTYIPPPSAHVPVATDMRLKGKGKRPWWSPKPFNNPGPPTGRFQDPSKHQNNRYWGPQHTWNPHVIEDGNYGKNKCCLRREGQHIGPPSSSPPWSYPRYIPREAVSTPFEQSCRSCPYAPCRSASYVPSHNLEEQPRPPSSPHVFPRPGYPPFSPSQFKPTMYPPQFGPSNPGIQHYPPSSFCPPTTYPTRPSYKPPDEKNRRPPPRSFLLKLPRPECCRRKAKPPEPPKPEKPLEEEITCLEERCPWKVNRKMCPDYYDDYAPYRECGSYYPSKIHNRSNLRFVGLTTVPKTIRLRHSKCGHMRTPTFKDSPVSENISALFSSYSCTSLTSTDSCSSISYHSSCTSGKIPSYIVANCKQSPVVIGKPWLNHNTSSICSSVDTSRRQQAPYNNDFTVLNSVRFTGAKLLGTPYSAQQPSSFNSSVQYKRSQVCSSAADYRVSCRPRGQGIHHFDERIKFELQKIGLSSLIRASKPAKCCRQTVLNQPSKEELPYAASLASLPLDRADIRVIRQSVRMAERKTANLTSEENKTKLVYYANLVKDDFYSRKPKVEPEYEVHYFYYTLNELEKSPISKTYEPKSLFNFFQIFNWSTNQPNPPFLFKGSTKNQNSSYTFNLEKLIATPTNIINHSTISSSKISTDALENFVYSDLCFNNKFEPLDSATGSNCKHHKEKLKYRQRIDSVEEANLKYLTKTSDSVVENVYDCQGIVLDSIKNPLKILKKTATKIDEYSQTEITFQNFNEVLLKKTSHACSQTKNNHLFVEKNHKGIDAISQIDKTSVEFIKKNTKALVLTSDIETDSLDTHLESNIPKSMSNYSRSRNLMTEETDECVSLELIAEGRASGTKSSNDFYVTESTVFSVSSKHLSFGSKCSMETFSEIRKNCTKILHSPVSFDMNFGTEIPSLLHFSKGGFIVKLYNSIDNMIKEIYNEAGNLLHLRKNRLTICGEIVSKPVLNKCNKPKSRNNLTNNNKLFLEEFDQHFKEKAKSANEILIRKKNLVSRNQISIPSEIDSTDTFSHVKKVYTEQGKIIKKFYNQKGKVLKGIYDIGGETISKKTSSARQLACALFDDHGNFLTGRYDSGGNLLQSVYDSQKNLLLRVFNSEMMLFSFVMENGNKSNKSERKVFNSQGIPVCQLFTATGNLLTSVYDMRGKLIRGTFLGNVSQLFPRIFDGQGKYILGRYDVNGNIIESVFDSHGHNMHQIYRSDRTSFQKTHTNMKVINQKGDIIKKFFNKHKTPLTAIYDVFGNLLCHASEGNVKDLISRLFDLNGFFILGRHDEQKNLIDAIYDENDNLITHIQTGETDEIGEMTKISRLYNHRGQILVTLYDEQRTCIQKIYNAIGELVEYSATGRASKLAPRFFDMAGYFISGRRNEDRKFIKHIYDHNGSKVFQIYSSEGVPIRRTSQPKKVFSSSGKVIKSFFTFDRRHLTGIFDPNGQILGGILSMNAEDLAPVLFDVEGKFINSRFDSDKNLIKHVYDSKGNIVERIYSRSKFNNHYIKSSKTRSKSAKTVYVKLKSKSDPIDQDADSTSTAFENLFEEHSNPQHRVNGGPKNSAVVKSKKNLTHRTFKDVKNIIPIKCQCRRDVKEIPKSNSKRNSISSRCNSQRLSDLIAKPPSTSTNRPSAKRSKRKETKKLARTTKSRVGSFIQNYQHKEHKNTRCKETKDAKAVTTVLPCYDTMGNFLEETDGSLDAMLDECLEDMQTCQEETLVEDIKNNSAVAVSSITEAVGATEVDSEKSVDVFNSKVPEIDDSSDTQVISISSQDTTSTVHHPSNPKDAFLCNLPNAPPFILTMNRALMDSKVSNTNSKRVDTLEQVDENAISTELSIDNATRNTTLVSSVSNCKSSAYTKLPDLNVYIDKTCPSFENEDFKEFVVRSITRIKSDVGIKMGNSGGCFTSAPTICMAGMTGSNNPFQDDGQDARLPGKNYLHTTDTLFKRNSSYYESKIPRMLHPSRFKTRSRMKNVQLPHTGKGCAANRTQSPSTPKKCNTCGTTDVQINPNIKVTVSTTCTSLKNADPQGSRPESRDKNPNTQASGTSVGDCYKGIKSDPGCYCGNPPVSPMPCPVRVKEVEPIEDEIVKKEEEIDEALCYCPPGEEPLLMKKSNIECDCVNRRLCDDDALIEPPKEKPNVFWALTKVTIQKDGKKNFEIIDISPVPPGYYMMPDVNNLVLVGPQPKPAKPLPSKHCICK